MVEEEEEEEAEEETEEDVVEDDDLLDADPRKYRLERQQIIWQLERHGGRVFKSHA